MITSATNKNKDQATDAGEHKEKSQSEAIIQKDVAETFENKENFGGILEIELGGKKYHLDFIKKHFEYPEKIQKETGILGYERKKIRYESLFNLYKEYYKDVYGLDLEKNDIHNETDLDDFIYNSYHKNIFPITDALYKSKKDYRDCLDNIQNKRVYDAKGREYWEKYLFKEKEALEKRISDLEADLNNFDKIGLKYKSKQDLDNYYGSKSKIDMAIMMGLSNGEYPNLCYTHVLGGFSSEGEQMVQDMKEDRFFVQKIFDIERIKKTIKAGGALNEHGANSTSGYSAREHGVRLFDKDINTKITEGMIGKLPSELNREGTFGLTSLNMIGSGFWISDSNTKEMRFGFPIKMDAFQEEYFRKSIPILQDIYSHLNSEDQKHLLSYSPYTGGELGTTIIFLFFDELMHNNILFEKVKGKIVDQRINESGKIENFIKYKIPEDDKAYLYKIFKDWLLETAQQYGFDSNFFLKESISSELFSIFLSSSTEEWLDIFSGENSKGKFRTDSRLNYTVFINHDGIPQLSWGHAKYCTFGNEKRFNFIEFKHADHLPTKE